MEPQLRTRDTARGHAVVVTLAWVRSPGQGKEHGMGGEGWGIGGGGMLLVKRLILLPACLPSCLPPNRCSHLTNAPQGCEHLGSGGERLAMLLWLYLVWGGRDEEGRGREGSLSIYVLCLTYECVGGTVAAQYFKEQWLATPYFHLFVYHLCLSWWRRLCFGGRIAEVQKLENMYYCICFVCTVYAHVQRSDHVFVWVRESLV